MIYLVKMILTSLFGSLSLHLLELNRAKPLHVTQDHLMKVFPIISQSRGGGRFDGLVFGEDLYSEVKGITTESISTTSQFKQRN